MLPAPDPQTGPIDDDDAPEVPGTQALMRGIDVLMAISLAPHPPRFGEVQEAVNIPKGTLHRLLAALVRRRLIRYDDHTRRYSTGSRIFELARRTLDQSRLTRAVKPELARIAREVGRPTCLYVADGNEVFVIDFEDPDAAQTRMIRVWPREKATDTAAGHIMTALLAPQSRSGSEFSGTDLGLIEALGYSVHTSAAGRASVAAAVCDEAGHPLAAISVSFDGNPPEAEVLHETGRLLVVATRRAEANLGPSQEAPTCRPRPEAPPAPGLVDHGTGSDFMGENPVWSPEDGKLYWLDILAPALRSLDPTTAHPTRRMLPEITGGLAFDGRGRFILLGQQGLSLYDPTTGRQSLLFSPESDRPENRFNTAAVAPDGALWAGTMSLRNLPGHGSLYRITPDLRVTRVIDGISLPKNCAWSPDGRRLYLSEGSRGVLLAFDLGEDGRLGPERILLQGSPENGLPNGIACDAEGGIWVAMLGGWRVLRLLPDGTIDRVLHLPIPMPTGVTLGGPDLSTLFITSTYLRLPPGFFNLAPRSGNLFSIAVGVKGQTPRLFGVPG
jgi:sugar lactone lactonase YvrE/DNA-binding IclR family transcriptional regulator